MGLSLLDVVIFLVLVFFVFRGYHQGIIKQTIGFVAFVLALVVAARYYQEGASLIHRFLLFSRVLPWELLHLISFSIMVLLVIVTINLFGYLMTLLSRLFFLTLLDNIGGAMVGLVKGFLIIFLLLLIFSEIPAPFLMQELERSFLARDVLSFAPFVKENFFRIFQM